MSRTPALALLLLLALACGRVSEGEAHRLVTRYNEVVSEAYRRCDVQLIDSVVSMEGPAGKRLTGLIGVRADMGLILDAHLDELAITGVTRTKNDLEIRTRERWSYLDRRVGTGEQVGEASVDHYEVVYLLRLEKGAWMVTETKFAAPPQVGRQATPWRMDARDAHAITTPTPAPGAKP